MIKIKLLTETNFENYIDDIIALFRLQFTTPIDREIMKWRYLDNPFHKVDAVIALEEEHLVGFIGAIPNFILNRSRKIKSAIFMNMMTHPDYGGQGVFSKMVFELENTLKTKGYGFIYCFPNYQSNHILVERHGWKDIYEIPRLELLDRNVFQNETFNLSKICVDNAFASETDGLGVGTKYKKFLHLKEYRKWRIRNNPSAIYDNFIIYNDNDCVAAYITIRKYKTEYNIVDIGFESIDYAKQLISYSVEKFHSHGFNAMTVWCPTNCSLHSVFEKLGFRNNYPITYFSGKTIGSNSDDLQLEDWEGWFVQAIDDNIY